MNEKYNRKIKGLTVDVYDVIKAFDVTCPALQHLIKKALCAGLRGHKDRTQDLQDIVDSALRAQCLDKEEAAKHQQESLIAESEQLAKGSGFKCGGFVSNDYKAAVGVNQEEKETGSPAIDAMIRMNERNSTSIDSYLKKMLEPIEVSEPGSINIAGDVTINITIQAEEVQNVTGPTTEGINELIRDAIKAAGKPVGVLHSK